MLDRLFEPPAPEPVAVQQPGLFVDGREVGVLARRLRLTKEAKQEARDG